MTILLVGSDTRATTDTGVADGGRSDAIMIARFAGVRIDHYVTIDFQGIIQVTDDLGGVDVVVAEETTNLGYTFPAGVNHLDGAADLASLAAQLRNLTLDNVDSFTAPVLGTGLEGEASAVYLDTVTGNRMWSYPTTDPYPVTWATQEGVRCGKMLSDRA